MSSDPEFWELLGNPLVSRGAAVFPANEGCTVGAVMEGDWGKVQTAGNALLIPALHGSEGYPWLSRKPVPLEGPLPHWL